MRCIDPLTFPGDRRRSGPAKFLVAAALGAVVLYGLRACQAPEASGAVFQGVVFQPGPPVTGRCCFKLEDPYGPRCENLTEQACESVGGFFDPDATCADLSDDPCPPMGTYD